MSVLVIISTTSGAPIPAVLPEIHGKRIVWVLFLYVACHRPRGMPWKAIPNIIPSHQNTSVTINASRNPENTELGVFGATNSQYE